MMKTAIPLFVALLVNPFTGAALRNWQGCCVRFSLSLASYALPFFVLGLTTRFVPWFAEHPRIGSVIWGIGLFAWYAGAPLSCLHALS